MMRKLIAALVATTTLMPVAAMAQEDGQRAQWRAERTRDRDGQRQEPREPRPEQRPDQRAQTPRPQQDGGWQGGPGRGDDGARAQAQLQVQAQRDAGQRDRGGWNGDRGQPQAQPQRDPRGDGQRPDRGGAWAQGQRDPRGGGQWNGGQWNGGQRDARFDTRRDDRRQQWNRSDADWRDQARGDMGFAQRSAWNRGWRQNDRYDWSGYRDAHRGAYRMPRYYAPSGWGYGYRRFSVGITLNQSLWDQSYWIDDPYDYRLPAAYGPYRWVRYYNDALLVDLRTGRVVDSVYDIFW